MGSPSFALTPVPIMDDTLLSYPLASAKGFDRVVELLRQGRDEILRDWLDRVRDNRAVEAGQALSDPVLLDHMPQLFDAILDRLEINRSRAEAEQFAAVHGFTRRVSGYDVVEAVIELLMFRRAIWSHLTTVDAPIEGSFATMERVDGMVDRAVITSLKAFLDPGARMLVRQSSGEQDEALSGTPAPEPGTPSAGQG